MTLRRIFPAALLAAGMLAGVGSWHLLREAAGRGPWSRLPPPASPERAAAPEGGTAGVAGWQPPGRGFVVWESNRSGRWRLWIQDLQGGEPRRLTPDGGAESERIHCCPHVAPDGSALAWLSLDPGPDRYPERRAESGVLHLIRPDGTGLRELAPRARAYGEHRAAIWHGPGELVYIDGEGYSVRLDLATGARERLLRRPHETSGWLLSPGLTHAVDGLPAFSPYDPRRQEVVRVQAFGGCQPYFSSDGRWGYWVAGAGGPLHRMELATRAVSRILGKNDPSLPGDQGYLYFPMFSPDRRLLAFAASSGGHDHWSADYDIYVAETDPERLEIVGRPARYAPHPGVDRFPDVFLAPLPLGFHLGEAPFTARLSVPAPSPGGPWRWALGDGAGAEGPEVEHTWSRPGVYAVAAVGPGGQRLEGRVRVLPPRVEREEETVEIPVDRAVWPVDRTGLAFLWETADAENRVEDLTEGVERSFPMNREGPARLDHAYRMDLGGGGAWAASEEAGQAVVAAVKRTNELTLEAVVAPREARQAAAVIAFSGGRPDTRNLVLAQDGDELVLHLAVARRGRAEHRIALGRVEPGRPTHVLVSYRPGRLAAYRDGEKVLDTEELQGDFFRWRPRPLVFGAERRRPGSWSGWLEGVALYGRALGAEEARENARRYLERIARRPEVPQSRVRARLVARSRIPTLQEISPYREALAVYEFEAGGRRLRVAHWVLLDGRRLPSAGWRVGEERELLLEPFTDNPQLESVFLSDTLPPAPGVPLRYQSGQAGR